LLVTVERKVLENMPHVYSCFMGPSFMVMFKFRKLLFPLLFSRNRSNRPFTDFGICFVWCNVGGSDSMLAPSRNFKRHFILSHSLLHSFHPVKEEQTPGCCCFFVFRVLIWETCGVWHRVKQSQKNHRPVSKKCLLFKDTKIWDCY
jgi:hypothetical protein